MSPPIRFFVFGALVLSAAGCSSKATDAVGATAGAHDAAPPPACPTNTGFLGDANCIAPPAEGAGFQLHYGPVDHDDPVEVAKYILQPGEETVKCYAAKTPNDVDVFSTAYQIHMRPGSHHLIAQTQPNAVPDGFLLCGAAAPTASGLGTELTEVQIDDSATDVAPENQGLAVKIAAKTQAILNFHVINSTNSPILSEAWLNYDYTDESAVKGMRGGVALVGGLGFRIDPGTKQTYQYSCSPSKPTRILSLAAHMHVHGKRLTAWKVSGGARTKVLETFNWDEPGVVYFDTVHQNPKSDAASQQAGSDVSGALTLDPTDSLQWECAVENTSDAVLTFRNEVKTGEMCVVSGAEVRADDPSKATDFTCIRN